MYVFLKGGGGCLRPFITLCHWNPLGTSVPQPPVLALPQTSMVTPVTGNWIGEAATLKIASIRIDTRIDTSTFVRFVHFHFLFHFHFEPTVADFPDATGANVSR